MTTHDANATDLSRKEPRENDASEKLLSKDVPSDDGARTIGWQLSVDAVDAHAAADFWAETLHYEIENNSAMIERLLAAGHAPESATRRHHGLLAWDEFEAIRGEGRRILFHTVVEAKAVKNRWHIDLNVGPDRRDAEVARLVELGARLVEEVRDETGQFTVMADPEGNEFCVQ